MSSPETQEDRYLDFMRDVIKISVYKCSCGFRAFGLPVSAHELEFGHDHGLMVKEDIIERGDNDKDYL